MSFGVKYLVRGNHLIGDLLISLRYNYKYKKPVYKVKHLADDI
jgi:hypothetical protein